MNKFISIIGAGHLGGALLHGLTKKGYSTKNLMVSNRNQAKLNHLVQALDIIPASTNSEAVETADILILAVKPQIMETVCREISPTVREKRPLIISLAGVTEIHNIASWLETDDVPILRAMTNTPIEFCKGCTALFANSLVTPKDKIIVEEIFKLVGSIFWLDKEQLLDPLTAAIGSAPAYVLLFMEALQQAAMSQGIPEEIAEKITYDVIAGTVALAEQSNKSFADLRKGVTTPQGITEYSLKELSIKNFFKTFCNIYQAASERIKQIKK